MIRTMWFMFCGFMLMQVYELFRYLHIEYTVPLRGIRYNGERYDIALPLENMVWFFGVFVFMCVHAWRYYELHGKPKELLFMFSLFVLLTIDMLLIMNKPFGWIGPVPICSDLFIGVSMLGVILYRMARKNPGC